MFNFQGISVDAGVSVDGSCDITHNVSHNGIEMDFGHSAGSLHLTLTEDAATKLTHVVTAALADYRQSRANLLHDQP